MFKYLKILLLSFLLWFLNISFDNQNGNIIKHTVQVNHPGVSLLEPVERNLFEIKNSQGHSEEFYMNVETVVCGDSQCRIDTVQIFWNALGFYKRLVCPSLVELEKAEGEHFTKEDYKKLNTILSNKNCSLKDVYKEEVVGAETTEGIDAYSGATIILNNNDYVKGAVWTCYTLWHWANGDIFSVIRNISSGNLSIDELIFLLEKKDSVENIYALEQMIRRKVYDPNVVNLILENAPSNNYELAKLAIVYFENSSDHYFFALEKLLKNGNQQQRLLYFNSILKSNNPVPESFFDSISSQLSTWNDYPSINLFLNILEKKKASSPSIVQSVVSLLENENFITARRAFWFLQEKNLTQAQQKKLQNFYGINEERM